MSSRPNPTGLTTRVRFVSILVGLVLLIVAISSLALSSHATSPVEATELRNTSAPRTTDLRSNGDERWIWFPDSGQRTEIEQIRRDLPLLLVTKDAAFRLPVDSEQRKNYAVAASQGRDISIPPAPLSAHKSIPRGSIELDWTNFEGASPRSTARELLDLVWDETVVQSHARSFQSQMDVASTDASYSGYADNAIEILGWNGISVQADSAFASVFGRYLTYRTPNIVVQDPASWDLSPTFQFDATLSRSDGRWRLEILTQHEIAP